MADNQLSNDVPPSRPALVALWTGLAYLLGVILAVNFVNPGEKIAFFWPSNALAAGVLILAARRHWPLILGAVTLAYFLGRVPTGHLPWAVYVGFYLANLLEIILVAWLVRRNLPDGVTFANLGSALPIALIAAVPASVLSAVVGATTVTLGLEGASFARAFGVWFTGDLFGLVLVLPLTLALLSPARDGRWHGIDWRHLGEGALFAGALVMIGVGAALLGQTEASVWPAVPYLIFPFLAWIAWRMSLPWVILATVIAGLVQVVATFAGIGLFRFEGMSPTAEVVIMKVCLTTVTVVVLILAVRLDARRRQIC